MDKLRMAHQVLGGSVPFFDQALFYRVHMLDVVDACKYAMDHRIVGTVGDQPISAQVERENGVVGFTLKGGLRPGTFHSQLLVKPPLYVSADFSIRLSGVCHRGALHPVQG